MKSPVIHPTASMAKNAVVVGDVRLAENVSIWYGAVLRGDDGSIAVGRGSNIQDGCVVHPEPDFPVTVGEGVTVGHRAILHGCTIGDGCLVGMGATVMNGAVIGAHSIVAAGALVTQGFTAPEGSLILGAPAKVRRVLTPEELRSLPESAAHYVRCAAEHLEAGNFVQGQLPETGSKL